MILVQLIVVPILHEALQSNIFHFVGILTVTVRTVRLRVTLFLPTRLLKDLRDHAGMRVIFWSVGKACFKDAAGMQRMERLYAAAVDAHSGLRTQCEGLQH